MPEADLSAIGTDTAIISPASELGQKEDRLFALEKNKEDHDHELKIKQHDLGKIGQFFGSRDNAITYVVAFLVVVSIVLIAIFSFSEAKNATIAIELFKTVCLTGIGYLTGKSVEAKKD